MLFAEQYLAAMNQQITSLGRVRPRGAGRPAATRWWAARLDEITGFAVQDFPHRAHVLTRGPTARAVTARLGS